MKSGKNDSVCEYNSFAPAGIGRYLWKGLFLACRPDILTGSFRPVGRLGINYRTTMVYTDDDFR